MRRRGSGYILIVLAFGVVIAAMTIGAEAELGPWTRDVRQEAADEARALADGGVELARAALARDAAWSGTGSEALRLGRGRLAVGVERAGDGVVRVVATGTIDQPPLVRPGTVESRRVEARLRVEAGAVTVLTWQDP